MLTTLCRVVVSQTTNFFVFVCFCTSLIVRIIMPRFNLLSRIPNDEESDEEESDEEEFEEDERPRGKIGKGKAASVQKDDVRIKGEDDPATTRATEEEDPAATWVNEEEDPTAAVSAN